MLYRISGDKKWTSVVCLVSLLGKLGKDPNKGFDVTIPLSEPGHVEKSMLDFIEILKGSEIFGKLYSERFYVDDTIVYLKHLPGDSYELLKTLFSFFRVYYECPTVRIAILQWYKQLGDCDKAIFLGSIIKCSGKADERLFQKEQYHVYTNPGHQLIHPYQTHSGCITRLKEYILSACNEKTDYDGVDLGVKVFNGVSLGMDITILDLKLTIDEFWEVLNE